MTEDELTRVDRPGVYTAAVQRELAGMDRVWRFAIVYKTSLPSSQLGINSGRALLVFNEDWRAAGQYRDLTAEGAEPEWWERDKQGRWHRPPWGLMPVRRRRRSWWHFLLHGWR